MFDEIMGRIHLTVDDDTRRQLLKKAVELYKSGPVEIYSRELWFLPTVAHYNLRYAGVVNQLMEMLDRSEDYISILEYANSARKNLPGNPDVLYGLVWAMRKLGMGELARNELRAARGLLTVEDYGDLMKRLDK